MLKRPASRSRSRRAQRVRGVTMIEVLVSVLILTVGLLGVAGLQARMQTAEIEAFQRAQAIVLLQDMVDRINANRRDAVNYVSPTLPLGTGSTLGCTAPGTNVALKDKCEWSSALSGAAETKVTGGVTVTIGAMNEARGCITNPVASMPREMVVAVVWQGIVPTIVPAATSCGSGNAAYGSDGKLRRAMIARIKIGCLQNDPTTGVCVTL
jgi:type IV pilus assembly protein PilV